MILSGNHDIFWIPACFDRLSNLRYWAWEKALKAFISRRARRARRERRDRLVARILRLTNSVHTSCPSGRSIQQFAPLPFLIIFMFSIASFFSVMLEWLYRASIQFLSGNHDIFWIPAKNLWEWQCCWAFCPLTSVLCLINQNSEVRSQKSEFCLLDVIIKEGLYQVNKPDLENSCYGIFTAAGYGIYFTFEVVITYGLFHQKLSCVLVICCYNQRPFTTNHTFHNKYLQITTNYHE